MFNENEKQYILNQLTDQDVATVKRVMNFAKEDSFWSSVCKTPDVFIRNFHKMLSKTPKPWDKMSDKEKFKYMQKRIHQKYPLSVGYIKLDFANMVVYEGHYKRYIPMEIGAKECYRRIMELYG